MLETHYSYEWEEMVLFFGGLCCKCKSDCIGSKPTKDHIIPITSGGTDSIRNIQPLCRQCNAKKGVEVADYRTVRCAVEGIELPQKWRIDG